METTQSCWRVICVNCNVKIQRRRNWQKLRSWNLKCLKQCRKNLRRTWLRMQQSGNPKCCRTLIIRIYIHSTKMTVLKLRAFMPVATQNMIKNLQYCQEVNTAEDSIWLSVNLVMVSERTMVVLIPTSSVNILRTHLILEDQWNQRK